MQIFCKTLTGLTYTLEVKRTFLIEELKELIYKKSGVPPIQFNLMYLGKYLFDSSGYRLMDFNIVKEATVHMTLRFRGGGTKFIYKVAEDRFDLIYTRVENSDPGNFNYIELKKMI
jgi:small subunit ribosomal protein S27Ae/ubiquitin C